MTSTSDLRTRAFHPHPPKTRQRSFLLFAAVKILALVLQLLRLLLLQLPRPELLLVQNPPSIPTLAVAWLVARLRGAALVIDWHNLSFSILSHSRGSDRHPLVKVRLCNTCETRRSKPPDPMSHTPCVAACNRWRGCTSGLSGDGAGTGTCA